MTPERKLRELIDGEKSAQVPPRAAAQGWARLAGAIAAGAPPLPVVVAAAPTLSILAVAKAAAVGFAAGILGIVVATAIAPGPPAAPALPTDPMLQVAPSRMAPPRMAPRAAGKRPERIEAAPDSFAVRPEVAPPRQLSSAGPVAAAAPPSKVQITSSLDGELRLITLAKVALDQGERVQAEAALREHQRRFPSGIFAAERDGLRVLMACDNANGSDGQVQAETYAAHYPASPLLDRIQRACLKKMTRDFPK